MELQKINWKLYIADPAAADPAVFFKVFNTWIPDSPEIFIDVADYGHVHDGPTTVLVGHHEDYGLDATGRRAGLLYNRRQPMDGGNEEKVRTSLRSILKACLRIEQDPAFGGKVRFRTDELLFLINDRGIGPNTKETYGAVKPTLEKVLAKVFDGTVPVLEHLDDPRHRFAVKITARAAPSLSNLLGRI